MTQEQKSEESGAPDDGAAPDERATHDGASGESRSKKERMGDGIRQGAAEPSEIRTPALWGLRFRRPLLHDGSAATIPDAIARHREEAGLARRGYERLTPEDREALLAFLRSL